VPLPGARNPWGNRGGAGVEEPRPARHEVVAGDEDAGDDEVERNYLDDLNPESKRVIRAFVEPALASSAREVRFQFERQGYFCADPDSRPGTPVFNRTVTLKDSWAKIQKRS